MAEKYISASEAMELAGLAPATFHRYANEGKIKKYYPSPASKHAMYSYDEAVSLRGTQKRDATAANKQSKAVSTFVDWIGVSDVLTSLQLDYRVYGPDVLLADLSHYVERVRKNPQVALAVYASPQREKIFAYISLLPLSEQTIIEILSGKRHETDISNDEIETYEREGEYTLLAESVVVDPEHKEAMNTLLNRLLQYWCDQYPDRSISKIYAQAESPDGDVLIQKLFFSPLDNLAPNAHVLNLKRPGASRFVREFQRCLEQKRGNVATV